MVACAAPDLDCCRSQSGYIDIDAADTEDVLACPAYVHEIMDSLFLAEVRGGGEERLYCCIAVLFCAQVALLSSCASQLLTFVLWVCFALDNCLCARSLGSCVASYCAVKAAALHLLHGHGAERHQPEHARDPGGLAG